MITRALEEGVVYVAGEAFYVDALREPQGAPSASRGGEGKNTMRLSFSAPTPERIETGVTRLARTLRAELEASGTKAAAGVRGSS